MGSTINPTTLRNLIRLECGNVGFDDLPDLVIESKIRQTTQRISSPGSSSSSATKLGYILTVSEQQNYPVPPGRVVDDIYWGQVEDVLPDSGSIVGQVPSNASGPVESYWRSDEVMEDLRRVQLGHRFDAVILNNEIWVDPIPNESNLRIYYTYSEIEEMGEDLELKYERALLLGACADVFRYLANRFRNRSIPQRNAGLIEFNKTSEYEAKAKTYDELFNDELLRVSVGI